MDTAQTDQLSSLIEEAKSQRLSPANEDQAVALLKQLLLEGRTGIPQALDAAVQLSWSIGVRAIGDAWPDLKESARRLIVASLNKRNTEQGRRIRMSVARGLFPKDPDVTLKMTVAICDELLNAPPETITPRDRQSFANVFIGKGKPWLHHLDLGGLRPIDAGKIIQCAAAACFPRQVSPFTQLSLIRWIAAGGRLDKLPEETLAIMAQGIERWQAKFRKELQETVPELPDALRALVEQPPKPERDEQAAREEGGADDEERSEESPGEEEAADVPAPSERSRPQGRKARPDRVAPGAGKFDFARTIQDLQRYVTGLERDLSEAREKLRRGDDSSRRDRRGRKPADGESLNAEEMRSELESLRRYNAQLETRAEDLRHQIDDLTGMQEELASSLGAGSDAPVTDAREQYRISLGVRLRKDYADFESIESEPADEVFREHYRILLKSVFETLESAGVELKGERS